MVVPPVGGPGVGLRALVALCLARGLESAAQHQQTQRQPLRFQVCGFLRRGLQVSPLVNSLWAQTSPVLVPQPLGQMGLRMSLGLGARVSSSPL